MSNIIHIRAFRVGGLRFLKIGRLQFSFCICRANPWEA
jgi:hypothetical protein